jgi:hypothetical protein
VIADACDRATTDVQFRTTANVRVRTTTRVRPRTTAAAPDTSGVERVTVDAKLRTDPTEVVLGRIGTVVVHHAEEVEQPPEEAATVQFRCRLVGCAAVISGVRDVLSGRCGGDGTDLRAEYCDDERERETQPQPDAETVACP